MPIQNVLAGIAVSSIEESVEWYERLLDRSGSKPMPEVAEFKFDRGGWLQIFQDAGRAGSSSATLTVNDLDRELDKLGKKGISATARSDSDSVRTAIIRDPDGNQLVLAQALSPELAS